MAQWLYKPNEIDHVGNKRNGITNKLLLEWLDKYLDPKEWFIEITGGEPGLYPEIKELVPNLTNRGYKGLIRTNGSLPIPGLPSFKRVTAWHKDKPFPKYQDYILILENPDDDWKKKEQHCKDNNIPHVVFPYKFFSTDQHQTTEYPPKPSKLFTKMTTMFSSGAMTGCFNGAAYLREGASLFKMSEPVIYDLRECRTCGNIDAVEFFIDNIPGFKQYCGITPDMEHDNPPESFIIYPLLDIKNKWVSKDGKIVGKLGDDLNEINKKHREYAI